jgi:DNA-binding transcriptional regulator GbsR (MarR family)
MNKLVNDIFEHLRDSSKPLEKNEIVEELDLNYEDVCVVLYDLKDMGMVESVINLSRGSLDWKPTTSYTKYS